MPVVISPDELLEWWNAGEKQSVIAAISDDVALCASFLTFLHKQFPPSEHYECTQMMSEIADSLLYE